jgi:hypothetical protein
LVAASSTARPSGHAAAATRSALTFHHGAALSTAITIGTVRSAAFGRAGSEYARGHQTSQSQRSKFNRFHVVLLITRGSYNRAPDMEKNFIAPITGFFNLGEAPPAWALQGKSPFVTPRERDRLSLSHR